ncbi:MAG: FixH family protein [Salibacteraceae bacterium]
MKISWGTGLAIAMVLFIAYIMFMVVQAMNTDFNLETEDYYAKELKFQNVIDNSANYNALDKEIVVNVSDKVITVVYPSEQIDSGNIYLYRPSDTKLDRRFLIEMDSSLTQSIDLSENVTGRYVFEVTWFNQGTEFFVEKNIVLK